MTDDEILAYAPLVGFLIFVIGTMVMILAVVFLPIEIFLIACIPVGVLFLMLAASVM